MRQCIVLLSFSLSLATHGTTAAAGKKDDSCNDEKPSDDNDNDQPPNYFAHGGAVAVNA